MSSPVSYDLPMTRPHVMGILNITPDSFSDGGRYTAEQSALEHARKMIFERADIIDIGGESTRPGAKPVELENEWSRLAPVLEPVIELRTPVSVDTYKAEIARRACAAGVAMVNDIWGLQQDPAMADIVAEAGVPIVMMHNRLQADPNLDIMADIDAFFERSMTLAEKAGIPKEHQILDPGFGFGKTLDQNYLILNRFEALQKHGLPILVGASRKRMIGAALDVETNERLFGSLAVHTLAMAKGAAIIRVHDVRPHADAARLIEATVQERAQ